MKFKKSKTPEMELNEDKGTSLMKFFKKNQGHKKFEVTKKELRIQAEEKARRTKELSLKIRHGIGKFFVILFIGCVIFSMILIPLLIVFG
ncbi:hypothetical protein IT418_03175 [bacterium]|nr:hypothetical protein [bacterium]